MKTTSDSGETKLLRNPPNLFRGAISSAKAAEDSRTPKRRRANRSPTGERSHGSLGGDADEPALAEAQRIARINHRLAKPFYVTNDDAVIDPEYDMDKLRGLDLPPNDHHR